MFTPAFLTPVQIESLKRTLVDTFEYRLHTIKVRPTKQTYTAAIYDGVRQVGEVYSNDREQALNRAKEWIDEQDEVTPLYDLHQSG